MQGEPTGSGLRPVLGRVPGLHGEPPVTAMKRREATAAQARVNSLSCLGNPLSEGEFGGPGGLGQKLGTAAFETVPINRSGTSPHGANCFELRTLRTRGPSRQAPNFPHILPLTFPSLAASACTCTSAKRAYRWVVVMEA